jgi:hypothetical protein
MALLCSACLETSGLLRRIAKTQAEDACVCLAQQEETVDRWKLPTGEYCRQIHNKKRILCTEGSCDLIETVLLT